MFQRSVWTYRFDEAGNGVAEPLLVTGEMFALGSESKNESAWGAAAALIYSKGNNTVAYWKRVIFAIYCCSRLLNKDRRAVIEAIEKGGVQRLNIERAMTSIQTLNLALHILQMFS